MKYFIATVASALLALGVLAAPSALAGQGSAPRAKMPTVPPKDFTPPRMADGHPDLQGYWGFSGPFSSYPDGTPGSEGAAVDVQECKRTIGLFTCDLPTTVIDPPDGKIPYQPWALARRSEYVTPEHVYVGAVDPHVRCWRNAPPRGVSYAPNGFQILQTSDYVTMIGEYSHNYRIIPTDDRPHLDRTISLFIGDSRGRWEGDTLVVDTTNLNGQAWLSQAGDFTSPTLHLVERWTLVGPDTLYNEVLFDDPNVYTRPWKMGLHIGRKKDPGYEILEFACHEGEHNYERIVGSNPNLK